MGPFDLMAASGKTRARQTAAIFAESAGYPAERIAETDALAPEAPPEGFLSFLEESVGKERILCVGHLPSIAAIASLLLCPGGSVGLVFGAGTVCRIRLPSVHPGEGELLLFF
jgi:phosphohistidine phosphatase SixA